MFEPTSSLSDGGALANVLTGLLLNAGIDRRYCRLRDATLRAAHVESEYAKARPQVLHGQIDPQQFDIQVDNALAHARVPCAHQVPP